MTCRQTSTARPSTVHPVWVTVRMAQALAQGFRTASSSADALTGAGVVICATGNLALRADDFARLANGAYVASVTSADDELELAGLDVLYERSPPVMTSHAMPRPVTTSMSSTTATPSTSCTAPRSARSSTWSRQRSWRRPPRWLPGILSRDCTNAMTTPASSLRPPGCRSSMEHHDDHQPRYL
jgi:hypothetical protein